MHERIVITGIGMVTSVGADRESTWQAVQTGQSGVRRLENFAGLPPDMMLGATVENLDPIDHLPRDFPLAFQAAEEAMADCQIDLDTIDRTRFGCAMTAYLGDTPGHRSLRRGPSLAGSNEQDEAWAECWLPNTICSEVAQRFQLEGPRICSSSACASGTILTLQAVRALQDNQCDIALAGASQSIHPLLAAGFNNMRVLANHENPAEACRPFDANRTGFVMGEGSAVLVLERLSHAQARRAPIYAEIAGGRMCAEAHHLTGLNADSKALTWLIRETLKSSQLAPSDISYINAHGTGTLQNDVMETRGIRDSFGQAADSVCLSSVKSTLGHLLNAAGSVELAISILALRDGFAPPTVNLTDPDPACDLDCIPFVGRRQEFEHALKLSIAFGGHLAAVALRRWSNAGERTSQLTHRHVA